MLTIVNNGGGLRITVKKTKQGLEIAMADTSAIPPSPDTPAPQGEEKAPSALIKDALRPEAETQEWKTLISAIKAGDQTAIETLYNHTLRKMRYYFSHYIGQEAEDAFQDFFIKALHAIQAHELRDPQKFISYCATIARRTLSPYIKKEKEKRGAEVSIDEMKPRDKRNPRYLAGMDLPDYRATPEQHVMNQQKIAAEKSALGKLSGRDREILMRFYILEQDPETIMKEMNLTETQYRLYKSRAKANFGAIGSRLAGNRQPPDASPEEGKTGKPAVRSADNIVIPTEGGREALTKLMQATNNSGYAKVRGREALARLMQTVNDAGYWSDRVDAPPETQTPSRKK
jgi:RNA polymerase sigma factor (sigma-70 family)